jgi:hypothetical protein
VYQEVGALEIAMEHRRIEPGERQTPSISDKEWKRAELRERASRPAGNALVQIVDRHGQLLGPLHKRKHQEPSEEVFVRQNEVENQKQYSE